MTDTLIPRIVFVEDVSADAELVTQALHRAGIKATIVRVETESTLIHAIAEFAPDIIFTDHSLPTFSADEALRIAAQHAPATPVIIVTGSLNEEIAADYIKAGAADYVLKTNLTRLAPAVLRALDLRRARERQAQAQDDLRHSEERYRALIDQAADAIIITMLWAV